MFRQNGGSSTCVVEPVELQEITQQLQKPENVKLSAPSAGLNTHDAAGSQHVLPETYDPVENLPSPTTTPAEKLERWNTPRLNLWRTLAAFWSFVVMGSNDAAYGVRSTEQLD
jgi:hypothetical protein